ncbi:unnamed protein product [Vitrella brassicaformis CCMP3155]|uniref:Flavin-containing monooxygenase n=1 Tax=Vitrella brassicaformis (strain CCMP3155) TaxID=1169540 RepID=A0A0G4EDF8_VITBC|nr:unnamed protein product [Vitrella brassicaformis CCMP3155]|mmetsp:Transcript_5984/g.17073  ORF Transcript_5984/g.17073 Transcript_5984/m.17073 type:complete len:437 (-) Transcript_5984:633-1943(-)|eukprot:CEL93405.1 unnamed protein product [Vitrella brassicaformis CCMP3155]
MCQGDSKRVAVIGAGAGGLVAAKLLRDEGFRVKVFEATDKIGGLWVYSDTRGALYKSLRTNLPKQIMAYSDFPFSPSLPSFMNHQDVLRYLHSYAERFNLHEVIALSTPVRSAEYVSAHGDGARGGWLINGEELFEALVVANGHYNVPNYPQLIKNDFSGFAIHSKEYRSPSPFANQRVLIVGGGPSGLDLVSEIASVAKMVVWSGTSFSDPDTAATVRSKLPPNVKPVGRLEGLESDGRYLVKGAANELVTSDGTIDAVIYATGYKYDFPFFSESSGLFPSRTMNRPESVRDALYVHLFHRKHPSTLFFLGLPALAPGIFKVMEHQTKAIIAVLKGTVSTEGLASLPSFPWVMLEAAFPYCVLLDALAAGTHDAFPHDYQQVTVKLPRDIDLRMQVFRDTIAAIASMPDRYKEREYRIIDECDGGGGEIKWEVVE